MRMLKTWPALSLAALTGCVSMAPRYRVPEAPVPKAWSAETTPAGRAAADLAWQDFFVDRRLRQVLDLALRNNRDLRIAALNAERARAAYRIQRADLLPRVSAIGQGTKQRLPASVSGTGQALVVEQDAVSVGVSAWELDLFGRVRSLKNQALEQYLATEQARNGAQIALLGEVASTYLALAADRENLQLAQDTLANQEASAKLIRRRFEVGASSELDVHRAQVSVETARGDVARYTRAVALDGNTLRLLVGSEVPADWLPEALGSAPALQDLAPGLPSETLARRPDILAAEHQLKAANANIGAARAAFFPRITLTSSLGTMGSELSGLFKTGSDTWAFSPQVVLPIFDTGARRANLKAAHAGRDLALAQYEKALQVAFREVADALVQRDTLGDQLAAQTALVQALEGAHRLAQARYTAGLDGYLSVLDAQRSLYAAQQGLIVLRQAKAGSLIGLYKVLGGGWRPSTPPAADTASPGPAKAASVP